MGLPKRKLVFQPSIFRCYISFRGCSWGIITASSLQDSNERSSTVDRCLRLNDWRLNCENWLLEHQYFLQPNLRATLHRISKLKGLLLWRKFLCLNNLQRSLQDDQVWRGRRRQQSGRTRWTWRSPKSGFWDRRSLTIWQLEKTFWPHPGNEPNVLMHTNCGVKFHPSATYVFSAIYRGVTHNFRIYNDHLNHLWALSYTRLTRVYGQRGRLWPYLLGVGCDPTSLWGVGSQLTL